MFVQLRDCLYQDDAVTGEAAGLAMGLVMVGGMQPEAYQEMVQYVCDTQHDKIQRGLRTGIALLAYGTCPISFLQGNKFISVLNIKKRAAVQVC